MMIRLDMRQRCRYCRARAVHPEGGQPRFLGALDIQLQVIPHIGNLGRRQSQRLAGCVKDCRIRFGRTQLVRRDSYLEMLSQSNVLQVGCAIVSEPIRIRCDNRGRHSLTSENKVTWLRARVNTRIASSTPDSATPQAAKASDRH